MMGRTSCSGLEIGGRSILPGPYGCQPRLVRDGLDRLHRRHRGQGLVRPSLAVVPEVPMYKETARLVVGFANSVWDFKQRPEH
jgi:hypothetical protein